MPEPLVRRVSQNAQIINRLSRVTSRQIRDSTWMSQPEAGPNKHIMQKISSSASGFFNIRSLLASSLCGVGALLAIAGLGAHTENAAAATIASGARIYVTTTVQKIGEISTGGCSLQEAIYSAVLHQS